MMKPSRVMIFYDGGYFRQGQIYFRYKEERGWFSLPELHTTIEKYVASKAKSPMEVTKVVGAHFYDGRTTTRASEADQLEKDRDFEMALISAGIVPHYLALKETPKVGAAGDEIAYKLAQKGVDVKLALDVLDFAHEDRLDVAVLITGDGDFVPLVHKITSLGKQALIAHTLLLKAGRIPEIKCTSLAIHLESWSMWRVGLSISTISLTTTIGKRRSGHSSSSRKKKELKQVSDFAAA